jgi:hypothetical protein
MKSLKCDEVKEQAGISGQRVIEKKNDIEMVTKLTK